MLQLRRLACALLTLPLLLAASAHADWRTDLTSLLAAPDDSPQQTALLEQVLAGQPAWADLATALRSVPVPAAPPLAGLPAEATGQTGGLYASQVACRDGVARPYVVYVPAGYDPAQPRPLLVILHGGVSRPDLRPEPLAYAGRSPFLPLAEATGSLTLFPFGQAGCTWWDACGMDMIEAEVGAVRRQFNVDAQRIAMGGFSDGGSAGFIHAMLRPDPYCAFICLNGHMGVGSLDGGLPTYAPNLANRPIYAVTTFDDPLYPSAALRPTIALAQGCGADIAYRELPGVHEFSYGGTESPRIVHWLAAQPRDPAPRRIVWETASPEFGRCSWLEVTRIAAAAPATWYVDRNCVLVDSAVTFGFNNDPQFAGPGISVASVVPDSAAAQLGLQVGDVITGCAAGLVADMAALAAYKATLQRGSPVALTVRRGTASLALTGALPPPENYFLFKRDKPSAYVEASFSANHFDLRSSRLGAVRLWLNPDMVDFDQPLVVRVDGVERFNALVKPDSRLLLAQYLASRDAGALYAGKVELDLAGQ